MNDLKMHQPSMTIDEQIENLKSLGLIIADEEYAKTILNEISYFRLVKAYSLNLKYKNDNYKKGVTFEKIVRLYSFNTKFRQLIFPEIEKIEIYVRCRIANYFSDCYGVRGYLDSENFANEEFHRRFLDDIREEIGRNAKSPFVRNFRENYDGGHLPLYALVEIMSFGTLSKFYKNLKNSDKKVIASTFGIGYTYFESWLESISYVRNICAHYGRIYNAQFIKKPMLYKEYTKDGISNDRMFGVLLCMKHILKSDKHWNAFVEQVNELLDNYDEVDKTTMGFSDNWFELLKNE